MRPTNMMRSRLGLLVATAALFAVSCGSGEPAATDLSSTVTSVPADGFVPTTTQQDGVEVEPEVVEFDPSVFDTDWTLDSEEVGAFAVTVGLAPEDAIKVLRFQSAASQAMGDPEEVFGVRFIESAFTPGSPELTVFVTHLEPADQQWLDAINAQPTGGRFLAVEAPELAEERAARCPSFSSIAISPPDLELQVSVDTTTVKAGEQFAGHVTVYNPTGADIAFGGYPSFLGVLLKSASNEVVAWPLAQEPILRRDWVIGSNQTIEIGFTGGTQPCGYGAPEQLPPGPYDVGVAWAWGVLGSVAIEVVAP